MTSQKCKYAERCPVFSGELKEEDKPLFIYHNIFCKAGPRGWNACKRFNLYELGTDPGLSILPENNEPVEDIVPRIKGENSENEQHPGSD